MVTLLFRTVCSPPATSNCNDAHVLAFNRDAIASSLATIDLTSVPRRFTFGEALHLTQRFRVVGLRVSLDLPASSGGGAGSTPVGGAVPPPLSTTLKTLDLSSCRGRWGGLVATYLAACGAVQRLNLDNSNAAGDVAELFGNKVMDHKAAQTTSHTISGVSASNTYVISSSISPNLF